MSKGTELQSFRISAQLWKRFAEQANAAGTNRSEVLRQFICWYLGAPGAEQPERPKAADAD